MSNSRRTAEPIPDRSPTLPHFATWLRDEIGYQKHNPHSFARFIGVRPSVVHGWVHGARPQRQHWNRIAQGLSVPVEAVAATLSHSDDLDDMTTRAGGLSARDADDLRALRDAPPDLRRAVREWPRLPRYSREAVLLVLASALQVKPADPRPGTPEKNGPSRHVQSNRRDPDQWLSDDHERDLLNTQTVRLGRPGFGRRPS